MFDIAKYNEAASVEEALELLAGDSEAKLIAGGTDILIRLRHGKIRDARLIGIRHIGELHRIEIDPTTGHLMIGAAVTFSQLMDSSLLRTHVPLIAQAVSDVGGPQIRRVATIGGNLCNGAPSADSAPALLVLNATLHIAGPGGTRQLPLSRFYQGPGQVDLNRGELLTAVSVAPADYSGLAGHYIKYAMRRAMDIATLGCAVACRVDADGVLQDVRLAFGVAAPTPIRCPRTEELFRGQIFTPDLAVEFGQAAAQEIQPRTSWRATREFRLHLAQELSREALTQSYVKAGGRLP